jgi:AcrR family transcriptional regulator
MGEGQGGGRRGRPRDAAVDEAILRAGWAVLAEAGYVGLTFEAVAERAGCSRPALYRRFAGRRELVLALIETSMAAVEPYLVGVNDPRRELVEHVCGLVRYLSLPGGAATMALAQARRSDAALGQALDALFERERRFYEEALHAAAPDGLGQDHAHLLIDALLGAVMFRVALRDASLSREEVEVLVDQAIRSARAEAGRMV